MSKILKNNIDSLKVLARANKKQRKAIVDTANSELILCICECVFNILNGHVKITAGNKKKLARYKSVLRRLATRDCPVNDRRKLIIQKGGFLPILLSPILNVAGQLLSDIILNKK